MKIELKIFVVWIVLLILLRLLYTLPHGYSEPIVLINISLQLLMCVISYQISKYSANNQKFIYRNFAIYFGSVIIMLTSSFIGHSILPLAKFPYAGVFYRLYVNKFTLDFCMLFIPVYILFDYFLLKQTLIKYLLSFLVTFFVLIYWFFPFLINPFKLYNEKDYSAFQVLKSAEQKWVMQYHQKPDENELAQSYLRSQTLGMVSISFTEALNTVHQLQPYLNEGGETEIFWKPTNLVSIYVNIIDLAIIALILFYLYKHNRPYYAYVDKFLILFFIKSVLEILHAYGSLHSVSLENYHTIFSIGQYFTVGLFLIMVYSFDLKLRFVLSPTGNYYEKIIEQSPSSLTRWRDEIDNMILKAFSKSAEPWNSIALKELNNEKKKEVSQ